MKLYITTSKKEEIAILAVTQEYEALLYYTALGYLGDGHEAIGAVQEKVYYAFRKKHTVRSVCNIV